MQGRRGANGCARPGDRQIAELGLRIIREEDATADSAFEPETTAAMAAAFDKACLTIYSTHQADVIKEIIARQIIALARDGETDADSLYRRALQALGLDRSSGSSASSERAA